MNKNKYKAVKGDLGRYYILDQETELVIVWVDSKEIATRVAKQFNQDHKDNFTKNH